MLITTTQIQIDTSLNNASGNAVANSAVTNALANKEDVTTITTNSSASVTLTLANNTVYELTNSAVTSLTFSGVSTGFIQAAVTLTFDASTHSFSMPGTGWYCVGADCSAGTFTPAASMRYNLAIYQESDRIAVYVMEAL